MEVFKKAICIAMACCCLTGTIHAQSINLKMSNVTVKQTIDKLKEESGYTFVFSSKDLDTNKKISISVDNQNVEEAVRQITAGQNVTYEIDGKSIIISTSPRNSCPNKRKKGPLQAP